jgi:AcrR family transcriptional regulator
MTARSPSASPAQPRKQPRQSRSRETVRTILDAAAAVLIKRGYEGMSTNQVAQRAGVSIGSLYQYFPSKEAIIAALIDEHLEAEHAIIREAFERLADAPLERAVAGLVDAVLLTSTVNPKLRRVFLEQIPRVGRFQRLRERVAAVEEMVMAYFEHHQPEIRPTNLRLAAFMLTHAADGVIQTAKAERPETLADGLAVELRELVLRYLAV